MEKVVNSHLISGNGFVSIVDINEGFYTFCKFIIILVYDDGKMAYRYIDKSSFDSEGYPDSANLGTYSESLMSYVSEETIKRLAIGYIEAYETSETLEECIRRITKEMHEHGVRVIK